MARDPFRYPYRPAPNGILYACIVWLAIMVAPAFIFAPERTLTGGGAFGALVFLAFEALLFTLTLQRVTLTWDEAKTTLALRLTRWPFASRERHVARSEIRGLTMQRAPRRVAYRLALVLTSGEHVPLTEPFWGATSRMKRELAAIAEWCGCARLEHHD